MTRLAAYAAHCEVFEIKLSRGYSESHFREDLKVLYNKLGTENKKVVFMFGDQHVAEEGEVLSRKSFVTFISFRRVGFLELINNMLTTGMVPALYADEEREGIISNVRGDAFLPTTRNHLISDSRRSYEKRCQSGKRKHLAIFCHQMLR